MVKIRCKEPRNIKRFHLRSGLLHLLSNEGAGVDYKSDHLHKASRDDGKAATKGLELQGKGWDDKGRPETLESPAGYAMGHPLIQFLVESCCHDYAMAMGHILCGRHRHFRLPKRS